MKKEKRAINVTEPSLPPLDEYMEEIKSIWENKWLTHTGPKHQELELELERYLRVENVELFSNGHSALELALDVLHIKGEVITTPFTFASTTQAIVREGLIPVFCDIDKDTLNIDVGKIEQLITPKTTAILPVHVYGNICDHKAIDKIAKKYNLKVIYDAAHAFGVTENGIGVGNLGDISMFSFHATKVFNTVEGGGLSFSDSSLVKELKALRQFGMYGIEDAEMPGTNAKMTEFHAAMGLCNLRHIEKTIEKRKHISERYRGNLKNIDGISFCPIQESVKSNYAYLPIIIEPEIYGVSRDEVCEELEKNNIKARKYFYPLTSDFTFVKENFHVHETPVAKDKADKVITLPLYANLEKDDVDRICEIILTLERGRK